MTDEHQLPATRAQLVATGGPINAIVPHDIDDMFRMAKAMHISGLVPATLNSPEKVMIAIMAGAELGIPPFQSVQSFAVINGRPTLWGDGLLAVVLSNGFRVRERLEGDGDGMIAKCELTRPDNGETTEREFSVTDAKKASLWGKAGPWQQYPKRMLKMRARAFALRDGAADVLRGFQLREEVDDYQDAQVEVVTEQPKGSGLAQRLAAQQNDPAAIAAQTGGFNAPQVVQETGGDVKPKGGRRRASSAGPSNDTAPSAEAPTASQGAAETPHDPNTGEIVDAEVEEIAQDEVQDGVAGPGEVYFHVGLGPTSDGRRATFKDGKPFSTAKADNPDVFVYRDHAPAAESDDFPGDQQRTEPEGEQSGAETSKSPASSGDSAADDAPYTEMAEAMAGAAHWLAEKQVLKTYAKTEHWADQNFRRAAMQAAWHRFKHLQDNGEEDTETFSDVTLFQLYLEFGTKSAAEIDAVWPTFYRGVYKTLGEVDQKKTKDLLARRKEELKA